MTFLNFVTYLGSVGVALTAPVAMVFGVDRSLYFLAFVVAAVWLSLAISMLLEKPETYLFNVRNLAVTLLLTMFIFILFVVMGMLEVAIGVAVVGFLSIGLGCFCYLLDVQETKLFRWMAGSEEAGFKS